MQIRTFASIAALGLVHGGSTAMARDEFPSPNTEGTGLGRSTFDDNPRTGSAVERPDIGAQSVPQQQASPPLDQAQGSQQQSQNLSQNQDFVRQVQSKLNAAGYEVGPADGVWGPRTQQALTAYQRDMGLEANGALSSEVATSMQIQPPGEPQAAGVPPASTPQSGQSGESQQ